MSEPSDIEAPALSVIVPAYNEHERLGRTLTILVEYLSQRGAPFEVLVVDDGSTDATADAAREHPGPGIRLLELEGNRGKGAALKAGVLASRGRKVLLTDADLSTPIEELEKLESRLAQAPLVIGSRARPSSAIERAQPFYRQWMGKIYNRILHLLGLCTEFEDTQCGFKLIEGEIARSLFAELRIERFAYDMELLELALLHGHAIQEVGVVWINSPESKVRVFTDSALMLRDAVLLSFRLWRRRRRRESEQRKSV